MFSFQPDIKNGGSAFFLFFFSNILNLFIYPFFTVINKPTADAVQAPARTAQRRTRGNRHKIRLRRTCIRRRPCRFTPAALLFARFSCGLFCTLQFPRTFFCRLRFRFSPTLFLHGRFFARFCRAFFRSRRFRCGFFRRGLFTEDFPAADFSALRVPLFTARSAFALFFTALFFAREAAADLPGASFFPFPENAYSITSSARVTGINAMPAFT